MSSTRNAAKRNSRLVGIAATVALGATLFAPAAHADSSGAPLTVAVGDVTHHAMTRGTGTNSFTVTVTNTTGTTQAFTGDAMLASLDGPSPIEAGQIHTAVTPLDAPATDLSVQGQNPGLNALFFPHGGTRATGFKIPAGAHYSWKFTVGAAADFPGNDDGLDIDVSSALGRVATPGHVHFDIAPALHDGHLTEKFDHSVTVTPRSPGETTLTLANGAGGAFTSPLAVRIWLNSAVPGLNLQYRSGGEWVAAKKAASDGSTWVLPQVPAGFAYQQTHSYRLRFTLAQQPAGRREVGVSAQVVLGGVIADAQTDLHVGPAATPAPTATSAPAPAPTSAPAAAATGSADTTAGSSAGSTQLAHTGSSHTGLLAGLAALLAAAGAFLVVTVNRRRRAA